jgi:hypothetical protein
MANGTILTTNPVQWASSAISTSGFGVWSNLSGAGVNEVAAQPATPSIGTPNYIAYQWCATTTDPAGNYAETVTYTLHSP